jgi:hypothetical protein
MYKSLRMAVALVCFSGFLHFVIADEGQQRQRRAVRQPIGFSHKQHAEAGIKCSRCHPTAETDERAGLPSALDCAQCHDKDHSSPALMKKLDEVSGKDIPWVRVYDLPDFVFFSHQVHLGAKTDCRTCHGEVERRTALWKEKDISMKACIACHKETRASTACNYCHELNR